MFLLSLFLSVLPLLQVQAPDGKIIVPNVIGMTYEPAEAILEKLGFEIQPGEDPGINIDDKIARQRPAAGTLANKDDIVFVAADKDAEKAKPAQAPATKEPAKPEPKPEPAKVEPPKPAPLVPVEPVPPVELAPVAPVVSVLKKSAGGRVLVDVTGIPKGQEYLLTVPLTGDPTIEDARVIVPNGPPPGPGPGPVPVLTDFGKAIKAAADKATGDSDRANTAQGLAMAYRFISSEVHKDGTAATLETVSNTALFATDAALTKQGPAAVSAWAGERAALRAALVDAIQTPGMTVSKMGDLLDQAAAGLDASAPKGAEAPSPAFWDFLLKLIAMLLPLLIPKATMGMVAIAVFMV